MANLVHLNTMSLVGLRPPRRKTKLDYFFAKLVQKCKGQRGCRVSLAKFWLSVIPCAVRCTAAPPYPYVSAHGKPQRAQDRRGTVIGAPSPDPDRSRPRRVQDTDPSRLTWVNEAHRCRPRPVLDANQAWPSLVPNADRFRPRALLCTTKSQGMMLVCMYYMGHTTRRDVPCRLCLPLFAKVIKCHNGSQCKLARRTAAHRRKGQWPAWVQPLLLVPATSHGGQRVL